MIKTAAAALIALAGFPVAFVAAGTSTALAPEPAKLAAALPASSSASASATYVNTNVPTKVRYFGSSWSSTGLAPGSIPAGTPCTPVALARDAVTTKVIEVRTSATGFTYSRCI